MTQPTTSENTSLPTVTVENLEHLATRVDRAVAEVQGMEPEQRNKALALKSAIEEFHKCGLTHIVKTLKQDERGKELLFELVDEPTVYALFSMHGLVRADLRTQVSRVMEMVRPYMQSHGGDVSLVDVRDRVVYVRLSGSCKGCSMSSVTLRNTVEESLKQHVPEIEKVEVVPDMEGTPEIVQLEWGPAAGSGDDRKGWVMGPLASEISSERPHEFVQGENRILLVKTRSGLRAYRNACAHQGLPLDGGLLDAENGTLTCPWHGFQFDSESGECLSAPQCQLESFPLRVQEGRIWVRPIQ